jgi:hypothetical protein
VIRQNCIETTGEQDVRAQGFILLAAAMSVLAGAAFADPKVQHTITAPYIPEGYELQLTQDCTIESSGGPPDAHLACAPDYGWRLLAADGRIIFPAAGYMRESAEWAFAGGTMDVVAFRDAGRLTIVSLPSGESRRVEFDDLVGLRRVEGLGFKALVWNSSGDNGGPASPAYPLFADGRIGPPIEGSDLRGVRRNGFDDCRAAMTLGRISAETLPNSSWREIVRKAAGGPDRTCFDFLKDRLAGRLDDGVWARLDPSTLSRLDDRTFASSEAALAAD